MQSVWFLFLCLVVVASKSAIEARKVQFSPNFKFGAASAAYQIEGAWNEDGKTPSIWDVFSHKHPEVIADRSNGDVAADSYHFYQKDINALKEVGFGHYRFSISWPRIVTANLTPNPKGIAYYNKLIDALIANKIEPIATMYHFDLPQYIQDLGGFTNPLFKKLFVNYANVLFDNFGDRVKTWITFNEPHEFCVKGYSEGIFAPGIKVPGIGEYLCSHNVLEAHAAVYHLYREKYFSKQQGKIGISLNSWFLYPKDESVDKKLVQRVLDFKLGWYANPIFSRTGDYPQVMIDIVGNNSLAEERPWSRLPKFSEETKQKLIGSADFLALNYYTSRLIEPSKVKSTSISYDNDIGVDYTVDSKWKQGNNGWLFSVPNGLRDLLIWIKNKYGNPEVLITENGYSDAEEIIDEDRITYMKEHLAAVSEAIEAGCNVTGYTVWSIIDNYEWLSGYSEKFGIYAVNFTSENKERTMKKSANFTQNLIRDGFYEL